MKLGVNTISVWFGVLMVLITFSGAIAFAFTDFMNDRLVGGNRKIFVAVLFAYSIYRGYRLYHSFKRIKDEE